MDICTTFDEAIIFAQKQTVVTIQTHSHSFNRPTYIHYRNDVFAYAIDNVQQF